MKHILLSSVIAITAYHTNAQSIYRKDFDQFCNIIRTDYAYLDTDSIAWNRSCALYAPVAYTISSRDAMVTLLEHMLNELHNSHNILNTNLQSSPKMVPTAMDIFAEWDGKRCIITDVRTKSRAEACGIKAGMVVQSVNDVPVADKMKDYLPQYTTKYTPAMHQYALNMVMTGTHQIKRKITVSTGASTMDYYPDAFADNYDTGLLTIKWLDPQTGYIKLNNSIGNTAIIPQFDSAIDAMLNAKNVVIDLSETPSGGNSTVARAIMGRFVTTPMPYQLHAFDETPYNTGRRWLEYASPRGKTFKGKVYLLVGHWTGSMAEGVTIGFDGMHRATVIGTEMAHLNGAVYNYTLDNTHIPFQIAAERLYHINGTPRGKYKPAVYTRNTAQTWAQLLKWLNKK